MTIEKREEDWNGYSSPGDPLNCTGNGAAGFPLIPTHRGPAEKDGQVFLKEALQIGGR